MTENEMRKIIMFIVLGFFTITSLAPAQQADLKAKIANIKVWYKEIKGKEKTFKVKTIEESEPNSGYYKIFKDGIETKIIIFAYSTDGGDYQKSFYYKNGKVFFVLEENGLILDGKMTVYDINRFYWDDGKLIQYLAGKDKKKIKVESNEFKHAQNQLSILIQEQEKFK